MVAISPCLFVYLLDFIILSETKCKRSLMERVEEFVGG